MAQKQAYAQGVFQHAQLLADRAMGDMQLIGGLAHAAQPRHGLKSAQRRQRRQTVHVSHTHQNSQNKSIFVMFILR